MSNLFLRHGEVENEKDVFYANLPGFYLSSKGEMQAKDAAKKIKKLFNIEKIITSPLLRARQTASIVNEELKTDIDVSYNIIEWSGPYEWIGKTIEEIKLTDSLKNYNNNHLNLKNLYFWRKGMCFHKKNEICITRTELSRKLFWNLWIRPSPILMLLQCSFNPPILL